MAAGVTVAAALFFAATREREPVHAGRPLSEWVADLRSSDVEKRRAAEQAVRVIGAEAVPFLTNALAESRLDHFAETARATVPDFLRRPIARLARWQGSGRARANAALALKYIGLTADSSIPHLVGSLDLTGLEGVDAVVAMGPAAIPELREAVRKGSEPQRIYAIRALGEFGEASKTVVPELITALNSLVPGEADFAALTLGRIGPAALPSLTNVLVTATNTQARWSAARALGAMGPSAVAATNSVAQAIEHSDYRVRKEALSALSRIYPEDWFAMPIYVKLLRDADVDTQLIALHLICRSPSAIRAYREEIERFVNHPDERARKTASEALSRFPKR